MLGGVPLLREPGRREGLQASDMIRTMMDIFKFIKLSIMILHDLFVRFVSICVVLIKAVYSITGKQYRIAAERNPPYTHTIKSTMKAMLCPGGKEYN